MNNKNIQKKIKSLLKEYKVVECTNRLGDTIKAEYLLEEYGELLVAQPVGDLGFELTMFIDEVVSAIGVKRR